MIRIFLVQALVCFLLFSAHAQSTYCDTIVSTLAGSTDGYTDGTGTAAKFSYPSGVAVDGNGTVYVADINNHRIRKITMEGLVTTLAGSTVGYSDGTGAAAKFCLPNDIAVDGNGNVYVADTYNHRIRKITPEGVVSTLAGSTAGYADGTGIVAKFFNPFGIGVDGNGNVFVADTYNHRIRKITSEGVVSTLAGSTDGYADGTGALAKFSNPFGIAVDGSGNFYVADTYNNRIRKITPQGEVSTLAGSTSGYVNGTGTAAKFYSPTGVAVDGNGNVYVADTYNHRIRKITPQGEVSSLAGSGQGYTNGTGIAAKFYFPYDVAVNAISNVYVADYNNHRVRKIEQLTISLTTGTITNPSTCNGTDGRITFNTDLAEGTYTLAFKKGDTDTTASVEVTDGVFVLSALGQGVYSGFHIFNSGCTAIADVIPLSDPEPPELSVDAFLHPSHCGYANGEITFITNLPDSESETRYVVQYLKNGNPAEGEIYVNAGRFKLTGLLAGIYSGFTISQQVCVTELPDEITLNDPIPPVLSEVSEVSPTVCGASDGSLTFSTNLPDGLYPVNYLKAGTYFTKEGNVEAGLLTLDNLSAGAYVRITITNLGCSYVLPYSLALNHPSSPALSLTSKINLTACNVYNGSLVFSTEAANGNYTLSFDKDGMYVTRAVNVNGGTFLVDNLGSGVYMGFALTGGGCTSALGGLDELVCPCGPDMILSSPNDDYLAGSHSKKALKETGKISASNKLSGTSRTLYEAASIELNPGFSVGKGITFTAQPGGCN